MQPRQLVGATVGAGRVVRIGEEDDPGRVGDARQQARRHRRSGRVSGAATGVAPTDLRADRVHQKAVPAVEHLVARPGIGADQQRRSARPSRRRRRCAPGRARDAAPSASRSSVDAAVGIAVHLVGQRAIGGDRLRAGPERAFVRREADRPLDARRPSTRRRHRARCRGCRAAAPGRSSAHLPVSGRAGGARGAPGCGAASSAADERHRVAAERHEPRQRRARAARGTVEPRIAGRRRSRRARSGIARHRRCSQRGDEACTARPSRGERREHAARG